MSEPLKEISDRLSKIADYCVRIHDEFQPFDAASKRWAGRIVMDIMSITTGGKPTEVFPSKRKRAQNDNNKKSD